MKKVLMISYDFPPSSVGIWRTLKFCRYMGDFGWKPSILTVKPVRSPRQDFGPLKELPANTVVRRTGSLDQNRLAYLAREWRKRLRGGGAESGKAAEKVQTTNAGARAVMDFLRAWILTPDDRMGWLPFALVEGARWLRQEKFDAIYTTCYPHTAHVAGALLSKWSGVPLLADFRDIWIGSYVFYHPPTALHDRIQRGLERMVIEQAGRVLAATEPISRDFRERYADIQPDRFVTLTNGFDTGDFLSAGANATPDPDHFTITYAGTLFNSTSPLHLFRAVRALLKREPQWRDVLRLRFIGSMIEPYRELISKMGLGDVVIVEGYHAHDAALRIMAEADALLLIVSPQKGSHIMLTQKVFEYVAARRPVLGLVPTGAARDFLNEIGEGPVVEPTDAPGIMRAIRRMLMDWKENGRRNLPENPVLARYHRRELTGVLCQNLDSITESRRR